jgi:hypothetical protein
MAQECADADWRQVKIHSAPFQSSPLPVFCLFAEDVGLLERGLFTKLVNKAGNDPKRFSRYVLELFVAMSTGGDYLLERIRHFNGNLFDSTPVLELTTHEIEAIGKAAGEDWSAVDVSISGTLFERGLNPAKRSQLSASDPSTGIRHGRCRKRIERVA